MTFLDAAIEVLRREGRPLHYDKITELAIKLKLLSHVGKDPEATMAARLASQVKLARPDTPLVRVKPGVFALTEWKGRSPGPVRRPPSTPKEPSLPREDLALVEGSAAPAPAESAPKSPEAEPDLAPPEADEARPERPLRPRGVEARQKRVPRARAERTATQRSPRAERPARSPAAEKRAESRRPERPRREEQPKTAQNRKEAPSSLPELLAEALKTSPEPLSARDLSQAVQARGVPSSPDAIVAALAVDNARRLFQGFPPLFSQSPQGAFLLAEREGPPRLHTLKADLLRVAREHQDEVVRELGGHLASLGENALLQLTTLALEQAGWGEVCLLKRSSAGNFILLAENTRSLARQKSLVWVHRAGPPVTEKEVSQLRGNFPQHDAQGGIIFALTGLSDAARLEASQKASLPIHLFDERVFAQLLVEAGVGVSVSPLPVYQIDRAFFSALTKTEEREKRKEE